VEPGSVVPPAVSRGPRNASVCRQRFVALTKEAQFE
jgi:hypothetical protein